MLIKQIQRDVTEFRDGSVFTYYVITVDGVDVPGTVTDDLTTSDNMFTNVVDNLGELVKVVETELASETV